MRGRRIITVAAAAAAFIMAPASASAATTCELSSGVLDVAMSADTDPARLGVDSATGEILVIGVSGPVTCAGADPTVTTTNAISIHNAPGLIANTVNILESSKFVPGATTEVAEMGGDPEIEIFVNLNGTNGSHLTVDTAIAGSSLAFGTAGINPNAIFTESVPDADIIPNDVPTLFGRGNPGPDFISAFGGRGTGSPLQQGIELFGAEGNDFIAGGNGDDILSGFGGNDAIAGNGGRDVVNGGTGLDDLTGNDGNDVLDGGPDDNVVVSGGPGDDRLVAGRTDDLLLGGNGTDEVDFSAYFPMGVTYELGSQAGIENITGTNSADRLTGDEGPNVINSSGGNDTLVGMAGNDMLSAGAGDDSLDVRDGGPDTADCGADIDSVTADLLGTDALTACETTLFPPVGNGGGGGDAGGGGAVGEVDGTDTIAPSFVGNPTADPRRFEVARKGEPEQPVPLAAKGTTFRLGLSEAATVTYAIERRVVGRRVRGECVKKRPSNADRPKCAFFEPVGAFRAPAGAGENAKPFSGRIGSKALKPGRHQALLTAADDAGNRSTAAKIQFKVVRPRR